MKNLLERSIKMVIQKASVCYLVVVGSLTKDRLQARC